MHPRDVSSRRVSWETEHPFKHVILETQWPHLPRAGVCIPHSGCFCPRARDTIQTPQSGPHGTAPPVFLDPVTRAASGLLTLSAFSPSASVLCSRQRPPPSPLVQEDDRCPRSYRLNITSLDPGVLVGRAAGEQEAVPTYLP